MHRAAFISNFDRDVAGCRAAPNYLPIRDGKFNRTPDGGGGLRRAHFDDLLGPDPEVVIPVDRRLWSA